MSGSGGTNRGRTGLVDVSVDQGQKPMRLERRDLITGERRRKQVEVPRVAVVKRPLGLQEPLRAGEVVLQRGGQVVCVASNRLGELGPNPSGGCAYLK